MSQRTKVVELYKTLLHLGKDYPSGYYSFRNRVHDAFMSHKDETDLQKIKNLIMYGRYITKEVEALYRLKKYRTLKRRYEI